MIEQKLIVGRYIELNSPRPTGMPDASGFQTLASTVLHISESESAATPGASNNTMPGFNPTFAQKAQIFAQRASATVSNQLHRQRTSETLIGQSSKPHRNFIWLEWMPGLVSQVQANGFDVFTGPMSGCWIMSYLRGGKRYIGHVGTDMDPTNANTIAAKRSWNDFAATQPNGSIRGFDPFNAWVGTFPAALPGESALKVFALVTAANTFHAVATYPQTNKPNRIRIAGLQNLHSTLPADGQLP